MSTVTGDLTPAERKRAVRRTAFRLALLALAFYAGFILLGVLNSLTRSASEQRPAEPRLARRLWLFAAGSFAFGFALVPLYSVLCDVTGYGDRSKLERASAGERSRWRRIAR